MLTSNEVMGEVERVREIAHDDEVAHIREDALHTKVLKAIAAGECDNPEACAAAALRTLEIDFSRWCA